MLHLSPLSDWSSATPATAGGSLRSFADVLVADEATRRPGRRVWSDPNRKLALELKAVQDGVDAGTYVMPA